MREFTAAINELGESQAYTTVLSLLQVMEQKGLVGHEASGKVYSNYPRVAREAIYRTLDGCDAVVQSGGEHPTLWVAEWLDYQEFSTYLRV